MWYKNIIPENIKKNVCIYLLQRYLGKFFEEKITRDQLTLNLSDGRGSVEKVHLDVQALNELSESLNWPLEFVDGYVESLNVYIPWIAILAESSHVEVKGLKVTLQPKQREESATSMFESMWNSMTSSMQLAEECAKQDTNNLQNSAQPYEGIENFAQTIESVLRRVKVKFIDTVIQLEHVPKDSITGIGVIIKVDTMEYSDDAGNDPLVGLAADLLNKEESKKAYVVLPYTVKRIILEGVTFSTVEFSHKARTFSRYVNSQDMDDCSEEAEDSFVTVIEKSNYKQSKKLTNMGSVYKNNLTSYRHIIMFGKMTGVQEIRLKFKQSEVMNGPKIVVDINFGSFIIFLSPRQFHLLCQLASGLASPDLQDKSNIIRKNKFVSKPMTGVDYQHVERELQQQIQPCPNFTMDGLQSHGWSSAPLDESISDEIFLPMKNATNGMYDSSLSGVSGSMESSVSSSFVTSATETSNCQKKRAGNLDTDPTAEISRFQIRLSSLAIVLLHEDLLIQVKDSEDHILSSSSVLQMQQAAEGFFCKLGDYVPNAFGFKDFETAKSIFDKVCNVNHLRLIAAPVQIEVHEKTTSSVFSITTCLTVARLIFLECLYDPSQTVELLSFTDQISNTSNSNVPKPNLKVNVKYIERSSRHYSSRRNTQPKTDICISLSQCSIEFDISIIDRLTALMNLPSLFLKENNSYNVWKTCDSYSLLDTNVTVDTLMDLKITSSLITFIIRFPIPDFRPLHDLNRIPWWKRNLRPDHLALILSEASLHTVLQDSQTYHNYEIESRGFEIYYHETETSPSIPIAKGGFENFSMEDILLQTRLSVKVFPKKTPDLFDTSSVAQDTLTSSVYGAFENQHSTEPNLFGAKRVVRERETHSKSQKGDLEELITPSDKNEIEEFIRLCSSCCKIKVEIFLPTVSLHLNSKHIYELIYNRINNDLLLWEPSAPKHNCNDDDSPSTYQNFERKLSEKFGMCKSAIQYESDSEDNSDISENNIFYSAYDMKKKSNSKQKDFINTQKVQSSLVLCIDIGQGLVVLNPPARESISNNVIPGHQAEFLLNVEDTNIFVVSGYEGDENLGHVCVQVHSANLSHCEIMPTPNTNSPLKDIGSAIGKHLHPIIHKSEVGMLSCSNNRGSSREMITVSVKIQANHETHHVKTVQIALGLNKATLKHRMWNEPNSWISQLLDFFDVNDYPISNYQSKDVLTEMYLHLWDCAVDYRPLHLPLRSVLTIGNFSMSSHLSANVNCSTLRFLFEDCGLFLSEKGPPRNGIASNIPVDLRRDYVNVIQLGLFELSLRSSAKNSGVNPFFDLQASNDVLTIHTCSDSCRMLMQLITYIANDGDIMDQHVSMGTGGHSCQYNVEDELVSLEPMELSNLSKSQHEHVNNLLGEAMVESEDERQDKVTGCKEEITNNGSFTKDIFLFPGEHQQDELCLDKPPALVTCELGDVQWHSNKNIDTDDEFCIIGNETGLGHFPKNGTPEINWLTSEPIRVVQNHFSVPLGKADLLKSPKHYPLPVIRYTLSDMTIIWHMYGGNDFTKSSSCDKKKTVNFSEALSEIVNFSNIGTGGVTLSTKKEKQKENLHWIQQGGINRNLKVHMELQLNKVRFQHELYPDFTKYASRQILIISDIELRDRLESSEINKFLYQYTSQSKPKQSNANMVLIKALHIRPDPKLKRQECCLKISLLPLRLNIDQDALLFLFSFFQELTHDTATDSSTNIHAKYNTPTHQPPVMTVNDDDEYFFKKQAEKIVNENLMILEENSKQNSSLHNNSSEDVVTDNLPIFFRNVIFSPDVPIRLDYQGKRVDMSHGPLPGLLMGLGQLNCSELTLKRITYRHGLLGFNKLMQYLLQEWLSDIKKRQLPSILGGVGPLHSVLQLFQGVRDLFWLPIEQYQKDGRIVRGLQKGANSFTTSTAMAALELTSRLIHLIQITAETAYDMLSPGPSLKRIAKSKGKKKRYHRPQDIREGMTNAIMLFKEGIGETADNIVHVASTEKEQKGYSGAVGGVLRQIPPTIIKPIIITSEATNNVLAGMKSQLVLDARQEANQKWRSHKK